MSRSNRWSVPAVVAGPIILEVFGDYLQIDMGKNASRINSSGVYVGGSYVRLKYKEIEELIDDLQEVLVSIEQGRKEDT
jgi:hypothetical protein